MIGLECNVDVVVMIFYVLLMVYVDGWQWILDLIWFNNLEFYGIVNYYV